MTEKPTIDIKLLHLKDAPALAPLLAAYGQSLKRGAPGQPDQMFAEQLLQDRVAEFLGASMDGKLVGFIMFYDLPDPTTGKREGQSNHIFVGQDHRGKGIAKALVDVLAEQGEMRNWTRVMFNAPRSSDLGKKVFDSVAVPGNWSPFMIEY